MKLATFRNVFALSMMIFLIASCGKDKKKKNNNCDGMNIYTNAACFGVNQFGVGGYQPGGQIAYNTQAKAQLDQWMTQPDNVALPGQMGLIDINFGNIQVGSVSDYCYLLQGGVYYFGDYNKVSGPNYCSNMQAYSKGTNQRLLKAMNGDGGSLSLLDVTVSGSRYYLSYGYAVNGVQTYGQQVVKVYVIDLSIHSMVNPIQVYEGSNFGGQLSIKESLYSVQPKTDLEFF